MGRLVYPVDPDRDPRIKTYEEALADPATTPEQRLRIQADYFADALLNGVRKHAIRMLLEPGRGIEERTAEAHRALVAPIRAWLGLDDEDRGRDIFVSRWRPAIYDLLAAMKVPPL